MEFREFLKTLDAEVLDEKLEALRQPIDQPDDVSDETFAAGLIVLREEVEGKANSQFLDQSEAGMDTSLTEQRFVDDEEFEKRMALVASFLRECKDEVSPSEFEDLLDGLSTWTFEPGFPDLR